MVAVGKLCAALPDVAQSGSEKSAEKFVRLIDMLKTFLDGVKTTQRLKVEH